MDDLTAQSLDQNEDIPCVKVIQVSNPKRSIWEKIGIVIERIVAIFIAICTAVGAYAGLMAYFEYKKTNDLELYKQIRDIDFHIQSRSLEHPEVDAAWVYLPDSIEGKRRADAQLNAIVSKDSKFSFPSWKHVSELDGYLWSPKALQDKDAAKIRKVYTFIEEVLYLVCLVNDYEDYGRLGHDPANTYYAYLIDLGTHPLFLDALWYYHELGYMSPKNARKIQSLLIDGKDKEKNRSIIRAIYPELLNPDWVDKLGQNK
jgi:hypothetical protein